MKPYPSLSVYQRSYAYGALGISAAVLLALFVLKLLPATNAWLIAAEEGATRSFNALLGRRSVLDWAVILSSSDEWIIFCFVIGLVSLLVEGWLTRTRHYGRLFGFALFTVALTVATEEMGDKISDLIEHRDSPWVVLSGLTDLREIHEDGEEAIDMPDECGFPDENVMGWSCLAILLLLRAPRTAVFTLVTLAIYLGAHLAMGTRWMLDMTTALFAGPLIAGAALVTLDRPVNWLERKTEEGFLLVFWRSLATVEGLRGQPRAEGETPDDPFRRPRLAQMKLRERQWHRLVRREVLPTLNISFEEYRLLRHPPGEHGSEVRPSPYVRFLVAPNREILVVKSAWRFGTFFHQPGRVARYATSARYNVALERLGLPVPRLYWSKEGTRTGGLRRYSLLIEEFIDGRPLDTTNETEIRKAMGLIARLHSNTRASWGSLLDTEPNARGQFIWQQLRPRVYVAMREMSRWYGKNWPNDLTYRTWKLFEEEAERALSGSAAFRLTHGDVTARNFLVAGERIVMIDFITLAFDLVGVEIIKAAVGLTREDPALRRAAWISYFEAAGPERWQEFLKQSKLSVLLYFLRELSHRRAGGVQKGKKPANPEEILSWLQSVSQESASLWGTQSAETDWESLTRMLEGSVRTGTKAVTSETAV
jgi:hypothetical protein